MEGVSLVETQALQALISEIKDMRQILVSTLADLANHKKPYLNVNEAMEVTGFGKTWLMANKQHIGFTSIGGCLRFKRKDVEAYMESNYFKAKTIGRAK